MSNHSLYIFDLDRTLTPINSVTLYPFIVAWFARVRPSAVAIATNQGGVGLRYWMEQGGFGNPDAYPREMDIFLRLDYVVGDIRLLTGGEVRAYSAFAYQSQKGEWSPMPPIRQNDPRWSREWRKPSGGMLLQAMQDFGVSAADTVFIGDDQEADGGAALAAGVAFIHAFDFMREQGNE